MKRMGSRKMDLRWAGLAAVLALVVLAPSVAAQTTCSAGGENRAEPYCFNRPGTVAPAPGQTEPIESENVTATTEAGEQLSCPDGGSYGATLWMAVHPHAPGFFIAAVAGIDARMVLYDVAGGQFVCSDDTFDEPGSIPTEGIGVRGLEAGKTYLLQVGGRTRLTGSPDTGIFGISAGFVPDRDGDDIGDSEDPCPDVKGTSCPPDGGGGGSGGGGGGAGGGGGGTPQPSPGISPGDPDPDSDGVRGAADKCPGKGTRGRDLNQDGCEDRKRQEIDVKWRIVPTSGRGIIMRELRLSGTRKGTKVTVKCSRGCRKLTLRPTKSRLNVSASKLRAGRLRPGTTIEVSVSRPGYNGETHRFTVKKTTMTQAWTRCLPEGKSTPVKGACY
jgi:hypothetical protein